MNQLARTLESNELLCARLLASFALFLAVSPAWGQTVLTVGPSGAYASVQDALDEAMSSGVASDVRIAGGRYSENLTLDLQNSDDVSISGGWDRTFTRRNSRNPSTIDGGGNGRVLQVTCRFSNLDVRGLILQNGLIEPTVSSPSFYISGAVGAGIYLDADGCSSTFQGLVVRHNVTRVPPGPNSQSSGAGAYIFFSGPASIRFLDSKFNSNRATSQAGTASGGGLTVLDNESGGFLELTRLRIQGNLSDGSTGGLYVATIGFVTVSLTDTRILGNRALNPRPDSGSGLTASLNDSQLLVSRTHILRNSGDAAQTYVKFGDSGTFSLESSLIVGQRSALQLRNTGAGSFSYVTNSTIVGDLDYHFEGPQGFVFAHLYNSIVTGKYTTTGTVERDFNLFSARPGFVNPRRGNYNLLGTSAAVEAGTNTPPGGLGSLDLRGRSRIQGVFVDQGAFEFSGTGIE